MPEKEDPTKKQYKEIIPIHCDRSWVDDDDSRF